jgi:GDPmannose 4,6-dehydratase
MKTALITGANGQDGLYMAGLLCGKGYRVIGAVRDVNNAEKILSVKLKNKIELIDWDMSDQHNMLEMLSLYRPDEIYNFAAYSSGSGMFEEPVAIAEVNGLAVTRMLEAIREVDPNIKFCQASSREIFGEAVSSPQDESSPVSPRSPYGAAKLYADCMIRIYRQHYGLFACSAILFNHESPRRGAEFVTRKITCGAAKIKLGLAKDLHLGNLDALRDWGFASDYVRAMWLMLQQTSADDYVIATGISHSVGDFCELAFGYLGLDYRDFVREDKSAYRPVESVPLIGCSDKAKEILGWKPKTELRELIQMMVDADMRSLNEKT